MRLNNSILNFVFKIVPNIVQLFLNFFIIRVYLIGLGDETYGFYQLCNQTLSQLMFIEGSVAIAVAYSYFVAFSNKKNEEICHLFSASKKVLQKIALGISLFSILFVFIIPRLNQDSSVDNGFAIIVFLLILANILIDYVIVLPYKYVIDADQKGYKVSLYYDLARIIYLAIGIVVVYFTGNLIIALVINVILTFSAGLLVKRKVKKEYSWLVTTSTPSYNFIKNMLYILPNKISLAITDSTDILFITVFLNYTYVTKYSNYNYIALTITMMISILVYSSFSSLGNFLLEESKVENKRVVFYQLNGFLYFLAIFVGTTYFVAIKSFIEVWIGKDYILPDFTVGLFAMLLFIKVSRWAVILTSNAAGLYKETYKVYIIQSVMNIILSLLLVDKYEIDGLLIATIISTLWFTYVITRIVFKEIYQMSSFKYLLGFTGLNLTFVAYLYVLFMVENMYNIYNVTSIFGWILITGIFAVLNVGILLIIFVLFNKPFRLFILRLYNQLINILKRT